MTDQPQYVALNLAWPRDVVASHFGGSERAVVRKVKGMLSSQSGLKRGEMKVKVWWNDEGDLRTMVWGWVGGQGD